MTETEKFPKWILVLGCILTIIGGGAGILGILSPTTFFSDFPQFTQWNEISYVTTGWGIRNIGMALAMILALWIKSPGVIAVVFSMRFVTETGDLLNALLSGHGTMGLPLIALALVWTILFLIPEALAARWGFKNR